MKCSCRHLCVEKITVREGAATVEFALVAPVFFLVLLGIIEFSWAFCSTNVATNVARETAHRAVMDGQTETQVMNYAKSFAAASMSVSPDQVNVAIEVIGSNGQRLASFDNRQYGDVVKVDVSVPYSELSLIPGGWMTGASIKGACAMMKL